jgi:hypothetical protein
LVVIGTLFEPVFGEKTAPGTPSSSAVAEIVKPVSSNNKLSDAVPVPEPGPVAVKTTSTALELAPIATKLVSPTETIV